MDGGDSGDGVLRCSWRQSCIEDRERGNGVAIYVPSELCIIVPLEWGNFIIELRKAGPMEFGTTSSGSEIGSDFERLQLANPLIPASLKGCNPIGL